MLDESLSMMHFAWSSASRTSSSESATMILKKEFASSALKCSCFCFTMTYFGSSAQELLMLVIKCRLPRHVSGLVQVPVTQARFSVCYFLNESPVAQGRSGLRLSRWLVACFPKSVRVLLCDECESPIPQPRSGALSSLLFVVTNRTSLRVVVNLPNLRFLRMNS